MKNIKGYFVAGLGFGSVLPGNSTVFDKSQNDKDKPNILFILADDLGYGDLGCYGNKVIQTPVIDGLSAEGIRFTDFYAGASVSSPSRCCLMTGKHTGHARIRGNMCKTGGVEGIREGIAGTVRRTNLQPEDKTIANVLNENGYYSCLVNKWHLDGFDLNAGPLDRGFDEFYGWLIHEPRSHNFYPDIRWKNRERYEIPANSNGKNGDHNTDRSTDEAIDFLKRMAGGISKDSCDKAVSKAIGKPFFLYLSYNSPHVPLDAKDRKLYENSGLPVNDQSYAALISHMDESIGKVLKVLKEMGFEDNTIVVFASDNGGASAAKVETLKLNGNLRGWKGELYEGGLRVPVIIKWPGKVKKGSVSHQPAYFPDFFATFSAISGSVSENGSDGINLLPVITGQKKNIAGRMLYWEQYPRDGISKAVRFGNWKAIKMQEGESWQLYNLKSDPTESKDVSSENPGILKKIEEFANSAHSESECWPVHI